MPFLVSAAGATEDEPLPSFTDVCAAHPEDSETSLIHRVRRAPEWAGA
jgi:hypothetical protein